MKNVVNKRELHFLRLRWRPNSRLGKLGVSQRRTKGIDGCWTLTSGRYHRIKRLSCLRFSFRQKKSYQVYGFFIDKYLSIF